jgi:antitoxin YefM
VIALKDYECSQIQSHHHKAIIKNGKLEMPMIDLPEGTIVEAILLIASEIESKVEMDETAYLLSTEANRRNLLEGLEQLKQPQNYIYVDVATL